jgi:hypothetical protein
VLADLVDRPGRTCDPLDPVRGERGEGEDAGSDDVNTWAHVSDGGGDGAGTGVPGPPRATDRDGAEIYRCLAGKLSTR